MKYLLLALTAVLFIGCEVVQQTSRPNVETIENVMVTKQVTVEKELHFSIDGVAVSAVPVDARLFDDNRISDYVDGRMSDVFTSRSFGEPETNDGPTSEEVERQQILYRELIAEGLSDRKALAVVQQYFRTELGEETNYISNQRFMFSSRYQIDRSNPFAIDGRYLTIMEVQLRNPEREHRRVCLPEFLVVTNENTYPAKQKAELLKNVPYGSILHESLTMLLADECMVMAPNSEIKRYVAFPSLNYNRAYSILADLGNEFISGSYTIDYIVDRLTIVFDSFTIRTSETIRSNVFTVTGSRTPSYTQIQTVSARDLQSFGGTAYFIEGPGYITRVDQRPFFVDRNLDGASYFAITLISHGDRFIIERVPLLDTIVPDMKQVPVGSNPRRM